MIDGEITYKLNGENTCKFTGTFNPDGTWNEGVFEKGPAKYVGSFERQQMNGIYYVEWGSAGEICYDGPVAANKLQGHGVMKFSQGTIKQIEGDWENDELVKSTMLTMQDGSTATNYDHTKGILHGQGQVTVLTSTYIGTWNDEGKLTG